MVRVGNVPRKCGRKWIDEAVAEGSGNWAQPAATLATGATGGWEVPDVRAAEVAHVYAMPEVFAYGECAEAGKISREQNELVVDRHHKAA